MGYTLEAIVADAATLRSCTANLPAAQVVALEQGFGLLPISQALCDQVGVTDAPDRGSALWPGGFGSVIAGWSKTGPVAYVEAEYFGGAGEQCAAVWSGGRVVLSPLYVDVDEPFPVEGSPISQALRRLGVRRGRARDEFEAVGLDRRRHTEEWIERPAR